jgi:hypothetical protein
MPYSVTISGLDFSSGVGDIRVTAGYTWTEVGGPHGAVERRQDEVTMDFTPVQFQPGPATFGYAGALAPQPRSDWFIALWIQEVARIANDDGWLFRSGRFTTEPPTDPIEIILAPEELVGAAELAGAIGTLPMTSGSTTITAVTLTVAGADIAITAVGTDTQLPAGDTFTYTATLVLIPNGSLEALDSPFDIRLTNPSLSFTAGTGQGFVTALLNAIAGIIESDIAPRIKATIKGLLNSGILMQVATRLNRGVPSAMPAGVVLSIRGVRATTRMTTTGSTEAVVGVRGALGAFGGVTNKFPALSTGSSGGMCFLATAAVGPDAPQVQVLRAWRDGWLRPRRGGPAAISAYERLSPPLARRIAHSPVRRAVVRALVIGPATRLAKLLLPGEDSGPRT